MPGIETALTAISALKLGAEAMLAAAGSNTRLRKEVNALVGQTLDAE